MPSPFPGMNPYLEQDDVWEDFHHSFIVNARAIIAPQLGEHYFVKVEPRLYIHELSEEERRFLGKGDLGITKKKGRRQRSSATREVLTAPMQLTLPTTVEERINALEIHDKRNRRVVTVVELLSPTNKTSGEDYSAYNSKRRNILKSRTHLVEIDLRRGGKRPHPPRLPTCDYYALVSRFGSEPRQVDFWPIALRERLPVVPIPLVAPDPDARLDLQQLLHQLYDAAHYSSYIYEGQPEPPLKAQDAAWAGQFLPTEG
jgi:hypothetical protein